MWIVYSGDGQELGRISRDGIACSAILGGREVGRLDWRSRCVETTTGKRGFVQEDGVGSSTRSVARSMPPVMWPPAS